MELQSKHRCLGSYYGEILFIVTATKFQDTGIESQENGINGMVEQIMNILGSYSKNAAQTTMYYCVGFCMKIMALWHTIEVYQIPIEFYD